MLYRSYRIALSTARLKRTVVEVAYSVFCSFGLTQKNQTCLPAGRQEVKAVESNSLRFLG
ncbi:MAG: hypothetical protein RLP15_07955 [Cryomorphaceae bacterium]